MEIRLKREDIDLLDTGKKIIPGTDGNAVFGSLDRDYIEVLIYDLNEKLKVFEFEIWLDELQLRFRSMNPVFGLAPLGIVIRYY